jgi:carbonic anhydrase
VHHTYCGATSFTADGIIEAYRREQGTDIGSLYPRDSICISDYVASLRHDVRLTRVSAGTPRQVPIYGYMYDIDTETLSLVVEDEPASTRRSSVRV